jgi:N-acetylglutamate synthase-like GNAT family acetyltransferase
VRVSSADIEELSSIYVTPSSQKRGIGTHLVQLCKDRAASAGLPLFVCAMPTARAFYQKVGFIENTYVSVDLSKWAPEYCGYGEFRFYGMLMDP